MHAPKLAFVLAAIVAGMATPRSLYSAVGPDLYVFDLYQLGSYGTQSGISAFSVGTISCNQGDAPANWFASTPAHPVISQSMFRLHNGRFEQVGLSWVKHGFQAVNNNHCGSCVDPGPPEGSLLGVGCSDPYSSALNGEQMVLGPRSLINALTGQFPYPYTAPSGSEPPVAIIGRRLQVHDTDLHPANFPGAQYFVESQYIAADDAAAGNALNNASYRAITVSGPNAQGKFSAVLEDTTQTEQPAIRAWKDTDPSVEETDIQVPGEGLFILAVKVTDLGTGYWAYEYAIQNFNSDQSGAAFAVPVPDDAVVQDIEFHDVDYHSGEPYDGTDWSGALVNGEVTWTVTQTHAMNPNANALRWGTLYNFRFSTNAGPGPTTITLGLFKPGPYAGVTAPTVGPLLSLIDCNDNSIADACDLSCAAPDCVPPCGTSPDCNQNMVPDECENDCNQNNVPDTCDVDPLDPDGDLEVSEDCNENTVPDECEVDCDNDGLPDDCDVFDDGDDDGVPDCFDLCPLTNPLGSCICPPVGICCFPQLGPDVCIGGFSPQDCLDAEGIPECRATEVCKEGCLVGDINNDGRLALDDVAGLQRCFSGPPGGIDFLPPSAECVRVFDYDEDDAVDAADFQVFHAVFTGP